jgi:hypothetical protein
MTSFAQSDMADVLSTQVLLEAVEGTAYVVNKEGVIIAVGFGNWDKFASENGAADLHGTSVLGRSLYDFITGSDVQESCKLFIQSVIEQKEEKISFMTRCDAPEVQRDMRLSISAIKKNDEVVAVLFQSLVVKEQDRPRINLFDPEKILAMAKIPPDALITTICSYCHDVVFDNGRGVSLKRWIKPEEYYRAGGSSDVWMSHGICPSCHERLVKPRLAERIA